MTELDALWLACEPAPDDALPRLEMPGILGNYRCSAASKLAGVGVTSTHPLTHPTC